MNLINKILLENEKDLFQPRRIEDRENQETKRVKEEKERIKNELKILQKQYPIGSTVDIYLLGDPSILVAKNTITKKPFLNSTISRDIIANCYGFEAVIGTKWIFFDSEFKHWRFGVMMDKKALKKIKNNVV